MTREKPETKGTENIVLDPEIENTPPVDLTANQSAEDALQHAALVDNTKEVPPAQKLPPPPPPAAPGASGVLPKKNTTGHKRSNTADLTTRETADEFTDAEDKGKKSSRRKSQAARQPTLQSQMTALMERMDRQAERTDEIYSMVRPPALSTPERPHRRSHRRDTPPGSRDSRRHKSHIHGSLYKRTSPKAGYTKRRVAHRHTSRRHYTSSSRSSESSLSDPEAQVRRAMELMEPRFHHHKGKHSARDDKLARYRPFAFLDRELQRDIIKSGHPEELTLTQHLTGLCAMAKDQCDEFGSVYAMLSHVIQLLEDHTYMQWPKVRAFSNTVVSNIARGNWKWVDDKMIERCRNNIYMRARSSDESTWSVPCPRYNRGRCDQQESHSVGEVEMRHVCMFCAANGFENAHTLRACNWKKGKNTNQQARPFHDDRRDTKPNRHHASLKNDTNEAAKN